MQSNPEFRRWVVGIDLDHTLVDYDKPLRRHAERLGIAVPEGVSAKQAVREHLWNQPEGDLAWQQVQADIYGPGMGDAEVAEGAGEVLAWMAEQNIAVVVVSHKSEYAAAAPKGPNLRETALRWMEEKGLFGEGTGLTIERVFFEASRADKVARIAMLGCTHFVDDLALVFMERGFPKNVSSILYRGSLDKTGEWRCARDWRDVSWYLYDDAVDVWLKLLSLLLKRELVSLTPLCHGRNSRMRIVRCKDGDAFIIKNYRDAWRMDRELAALGLMHRMGVTAVPRSMEQVPSKSIAIFEFVEGTPAFSDISDGDIDAAVYFIQSINSPHPARVSWAGAAIEAEFSLAGTGRQIGARVDALVETAAESSIHEEMAAFLGTELLPLRHGLYLAADELPIEQRILSPSDFGFHNAIRRPDGSLVFIDFEHFGWDDPCKLISDFLWHPAMTLSKEHKQRFVTGIAEALGNREMLVSRLPAAYPLFGVKWCTILLNEFLPKHWSRRVFAGETRPREEVLREQLAKARALAQRVRAVMRDGFPYDI